MKNIFIVNPVSGKGHGLNFIPLIEKYYENRDDEYQIIETRYPGHATEIAKKFKKEDDVVLYSIGGDGTMKEVLDGICNDIPLCVIPGGTGNDFYKSVDLRKLSDEEILTQCIEGEIVDVDYGVLNGESKFLNICSFGLDADINVYACDYVKVETNVPNDLVYAYAALKVGLHPTPFNIQLEVDGVKTKDDVIVFVISNGRYYGGMFNPTPKADISDGKFALCYIKPVKVLRLLNLLWKYSKGKHINEKEVVNAEGQTISFKFDREVNCQIDGENRKLTEGTVTMYHKGMKLKMPKERETK